MAPQARTTSTPSEAEYILVALFVFLALCLTYTLYRIIKRCRKDGSPDDDQRLSQFMSTSSAVMGKNHGMSPDSSRLTVDLGNSIPVTQSPNMQDEEKHLTDPQQSPRPLEVPAKSSTPFTIPNPYFTIRNLSKIPFLGAHSPTDAQARDQVSITASSSTQQLPSTPKSQTRILSKDRAEAITLDPKLAPVQGPLRPLSMVPSPSPKKRTATLFGLGFKHVLFQGGDLQTESQAR